MGGRRSVFHGLVVLLLSSFQCSGDVIMSCNSVTRTSIEYKTEDLIDRWRSQRSGWGQSIAKCTWCKGWVGLSLCVAAQGRPIEKRVTVLKYLNRALHQCNVCVAVGRWIESLTQTSSPAWLLLPLAIQPAFGLYSTYFCCYLCDSQGFN